MLRWAYRQNLEATLFTLDDAAEVGYWERIDTGVELAVHALNMVLGSLHDVVDPIGEVRLSVLPTLNSLFWCF
jgi:hypothetical protein